VSATSLSLGVLLAMSRVATADAADDGGRLASVVAMLKSGEQAVRVVCLGDSITGVYYHTGGRRAWCDMLGVALGKAYPKARLEMINAGISGHTTDAGLGRIERDVVARKPHLVVVMFGMNDVCNRKPEQFRANLRTIVGCCREAGAAVVLCTPNSVYPDAGRPMALLGAYAQVVRDVARERGVPLADCFQACEDVRKTDETEWMLLMSETIHPAMLGHKLFAEVIARTISGRAVSLADATPPDDALLFSLKRLDAGEPLKVVAMPPYDTLVPDALRQLFPTAKIDVTTWPVEGKSLAEIEQWAKRIRAMAPHLVVVAVPAAAGAPDAGAFIRSYNDVLNWSIAFEKANWDLLSILPSVTGPVPATQRDREALARRIILGKDYACVERRQGDQRPARELLLQLITEQKAKQKAAAGAAKPTP